MKKLDIEKLKKTLKAHKTEIAIFVTGIAGGAAAYYGIKSNYDLVPKNELHLKVPPMAYDMLKARETSFVYQLPDVDVLLIPVPE